IILFFFFFFFQAEDGIRDLTVTGVQTCALPIFAMWGWQNGPTTANLNAVSKTTLQYPASYGSVFNNPNVHMIPSYNGQGLSFPDFSQPDLFEGGAWASKKQTPAFADNFTKVWGTHTIKFGGYWETVG